MKKSIVWSLLLAAIVLAVAAENSVHDKKKGAKQVEIPTVKGKNDAKDSLNEGDAPVDVTVEKERDYNYDVDQWRGGGWRRGYGPGWWGGRGPGWWGGGGPGWWGGGGGPGWWGGGWRGGGGPGWWGGRW